MNKSILPLLIFFTFLSASSFAQRKGQRVNRYAAGLTYSRILSDSSGSGFRFGYYAGYTNSRPILLNRIQRHNGNPLFYVNYGFDLAGIGGKKIPVLMDDTLLRTDCSSSLLYISLPLSVEFNIYNSRSGGQIREANTSFISMFGGAKFSYLLRSRLDAENFKAQTAPYDIFWFAGIRMLGTVNGISLDLTYNKGMQAVFNSDKTSRNQYFMVTLSWNKMESGCSTSNRKRKHLFAV
jgi:hypothetical protein